MRIALVLLAALLLVACAGRPRYGYEEEYWLDLDGSGEVRLSGAADLWRAFYGLDRVDAPSLRAAFAAPGIDVGAVVRTEGDGGPYVHLRLRFERFDRLGALPAWAERRFRFRRQGEIVRLGMELPPRRTSLGPARAAEPVAIRFHLPSRVVFHNAPTDVERGNILVWRRTAAEWLGGEPYRIDAGLDRHSIFATTLFVVAVALASVVVLVAAALFALRWHGRRAEPGGDGVFSPSSGGPS